MDEFKDMLMEKLEQVLGEGVTIEAVQNTKNNGVVMNGVMIKAKNENVAPVIYVDVMQEEYKRGKITVDEIVDNIVMVCAQRKMRQADLNCLCGEKEWRKRIRMKLVNFERNREGLLKGEKPYIHFEEIGLAGVFFLPVPLGPDEEGEQQFGTVDVTYKMMENLWEENLSPEQLMEIAISNVDEVQDVLVVNVMEFLIQKCRWIKEEDFKNTTMFAVGNIFKAFGASSIMSITAREKLKKLLNADKAFVLPSSVHEVIVQAYVPEKIQEYRDIIRMVNRSGVKKTDFLSDDLLVLDLNTGKLRICKE